MDYCTVGDIQTALDLAGASNDLLLGGIITSASAWIDAHCGLPAGGFKVTADTTRYYEVRSLRGGMLHLDAPCLSVTTLLNADGTEVAANNRRLYPLNGGRYWQIRLLNGHAWFIVDEGLYAVTGRFGWSAIVPPPVSEATIMLSGWMFKRYQAALQDNAAAPELGQIVYGEAIPRQVLALLAPYRNGMEML